MTIRFQRTTAPLADTGVFARNPQVGDKNRRRYNQTVGRTLGNQYFIEDNGDNEEFFELTFNELTLAERNTIDAFFDIVKLGYSFTYTDPDSNTYTNCFLDQTELVWVNRYDRHTVTIKLRRFR